MERTVLAGEGILLSYTQQGTRIQINQKRLSSEPSEIKQFIVKSVNADTLTCHEYDGTTEGNSDITVAKPWRLRRTPFDGQTIVFTDENGSNYSATYVYSSNVSRQVTIGSVIENQVVIPRFKIDFDIIFADQPSNGTGLTDVIWCDTNRDGRAWAKKA